MVEILDWVLEVQGILDLLHRECLSNGEPPYLKGEVNHLLLVVHKPLWHVWSQHCKLRCCDNLLVAHMVATTLSSHTFWKSIYVVGIGSRVVFLATLTLTVTNLHLALLERLQLLQTLPWTVLLGHLRVLSHQCTLFLFAVLLSRLNLLLECFLLIVLWKHLKW